MRESETLETMRAAQAALQQSYIVLLQRHLDRQQDDCCQYVSAWPGGAIRLGGICQCDARIKGSVAWYRAVSFDAYPVPAARPEGREKKREETLEGPIEADGSRQRMPMDAYRSLCRLTARR